MVDYASRAASRARRRETTDVASFVRRLDWVLIGSVAALVTYGLWSIADITRHDVTGDAHYYLTRQAIYASIGVVCLVAAVLIDPDFYRTRWRLVFGGTCFLIAIVLLTGPIRGSKRWLDLGFFRFQPSEFGKVLFVLALAGFLAERSRRLGDPRTTLGAVGLALIPIFLVFLQPDFGSALADAYYQAWKLGAPLVKVFPAAKLGPGYIREVLAPLNQIRLLPTGGITLASFLVTPNLPAGRSGRRETAGTPMPSPSAGPTR